MTKAILIANPNAARTQSSTVNGIEKIIRDAGWQLEVLATGGPGDARRLAEYGVSEGVDVVAVFGGDGTTMQAAAALVGTQSVLGLIPGGTGNLLAGNLRLPLNPLKATRAMVAGQATSLDLGRVIRDESEHYFAVACGAGVDARVMVETASEDKHKWGMMAYVATTLRILPEIRNIPFQVTVDGIEHEAEAALLMVANCGEVIPPVIKLGADISPHDGLLDVVAIQANSVGQSVKAVWDLLTVRSGTFGKDVFVASARGREISVRVADKSIHPVQLDGDPGGATPFDVSIVPDAIQVLI